MQAPTRSIGMDIHRQFVMVAAVDELGRQQIRLDTVPHRFENKICERKWDLWSISIMGHSIKNGGEIAARQNARVETCYQ